MQDLLIDALRRATSHHHSDIEELLRLDKPFELSHYRKVLRAFEAFLRAWEPAVGARLSGMNPWLAARSRLPMIRQDMRVLGIAPFAGACCPRIPDAAAAWGSLYVIEGSALGGQVVSHSLARQYGIGPETGGAYFYGWGPRTGPLWKEFQAALQGEAGALAAAHEGACAAAAATFDALAQTFRMVQCEHATA